MQNKPQHKPTTVLDLFKQRVAQTPNQKIYTFINQAGQNQEQLTVQQLAEATGAIASFLTQDCGLSQGDRALLVYPPSLDFVKAFVGCLVAGVIPVPVAPPNPANLERSLELLSILAEQADTTTVLTNRQFDRFRNFSTFKGALTGSRRWPDLSWHRTDSVKAGSFESLSTSPEPILPNDVALLQYTSGSTSVPKGVMITHANISHQVALNAQELGFKSTSKLMAWLPHFHDFCLISGILSALAGNGHLYLMSPLTFLQRPALWFEVMSRIGATHTAAPNFAYELAVRKTTAAERSQWDLSHLEVMMSAAEPIRPATMDTFFSVFAETGLNRSSFCPAYGLAEHTVGVTVMGRTSINVDRKALEEENVARSVKESSAQAGHTLIGCGQPAASVHIRIVNPAHCTTCADGEIGEIWVDSPSKAAGYFRRAQETQEIFQATIVNENVADEDDTNEGAKAKYLRTGDMGFLHQGELFIVGRRKDLIIIRGHNVLPQDIELTVAESHEALRPGCGAAFSMDVAGEERLVVVQEIKRNLARNLDTENVLQTIRRAIAHNHSLQVHSVVLLAPSSILKTSSGKIQRSACRAAFLAGTLKSVAQWQAAETEVATAQPATQVNQTAESITQWMVMWLSRRLHVHAHAIDTTRPFAEFGLDSMQGVEFSQELSQWLDLAQPLDATTAWSYPTIDALAEHLADLLANQAAPAAQHRRPTDEHVPIRESQHGTSEGVNHRRGISTDEPSDEMPDKTEDLTEAELAEAKIPGTELAEAELTQLLASELASVKARRNG